MHQLRATYGWSDDYIVEQFEIFGSAWLLENYNLCRQGQQEVYQILSSFFPLARTPMDKKSGKAMQNYAKDVQKMIDRLHKVDKYARYQARKRELEKQGVKPGEFVVTFDSPGEASSPLFEGLKVLNG